MPHRLPNRRLALLPLKLFRTEPAALPQLSKAVQVPRKELAARVVAVPVARQSMRHLMFYPCKASLARLLEAGSPLQVGARARRLAVRAARLRSTVVLAVAVVRLFLLLGNCSFTQAAAVAAQLHIAPLRQAVAVQAEPLALEQARWLRV
jgi:hypothetical protein